MILRHAGAQEDIAPLWRDGFGDGEAFAALFREAMFSPENAMLLLEQEGAPPAAMAMTIPCTLVNWNGLETPAGMIYGLATLKEKRGRGYGKAVLKAAMEDMNRRGMPLTVLHPGEPSLYDFYKALGFQEAFYARELRVAPTPLPGGRGRVSKASAEEYLALRERFLSGCSHLRFDLRAIAFQKALCQGGRGDLYFYEYGRERYCLSAFYEEDGGLFCNELLAPFPLTLHIAAALLAELPAPHVCFRLPAAKGEAHRFGLAYGPGIPDPAAYYGFDFA